MSNHTKTTGTDGALAAPVCHWVSVTDASGRTHMEARWSLPSLASRESHAA
jgi:hypothetical protein